MTGRAELERLALGALPMGVPSSYGARTPPALRRLADRLAEGEPWDAAFRDYWLDVVSVEPRDWPPPDGRVNWTWLTDLDRLGRAVDLGSPFAEVAVSLASECPDIVYHSSPSLHRSVVERRVARDLDGRVRIEQPSGGFDLVSFVASFGWRERLPDGLSTVSDIAKAAAQWLRPGGWIGILSPNPFWYHQYRLGRRSIVAHLGESYRLRNLEGRLRAAGFGDIREYIATASSLIPHATPLASLDVSMMFVPRRDERIASYLRMFGLRGRRAKLVELGLGRLSFPVHLTLARR